MKKQKWVLNEDKLLRNVFILATLISVGVFVYKVATCGIAWISTTGLFG